MRGFTSPRPLAWLALAAAALAALLLFAASRLDRAIEARIEREAARQGLEAHMQAVRLALWPPLRIEGLRLVKPGAGTLTVASAAVTARLWGSGVLGRARLSVGATTLSTAQGLALEVKPTVWDVSRAEPTGWSVDLQRPAGELRITCAPGPDGSVQGEARFSDLPAGEILTLTREGSVLIDFGRASGTLRVSGAAGRTTSFEADLSSQSLRLATLAGAQSVAAPDAPAFGLPTDVTLKLTGSWRPEPGTLDLPRWSVAMDGAAATGSLALSDLPQAPRVDLALEVQRVDFARLLGTSGLAEPEAVASPTDARALREGGLGSASLTARVTGRLQDAASFTVSQRLDFTPPRRPLPALEKLRGDFVHEVVGPSGALHAIQVSPASPDFVSLRDLPPFFVRTLLLAEDSSFFGHRGVDLSEVPSALVTNWNRKGPTRGASTITQQLAKNLFLSHEKRVGRKLQELALALLLESTLGKERILEIYLNIIEWGPDLYGLRPAARRYFAREPRDLTPAQAAFLVSLIPGPLKYQRSFADGRPSPGFRPLIDDLLAKLRSVDVLSEEEYRDALAEDLVIQAAPDPP
jgi:hypothetical protein